MAAAPASELDAHVGFWLRYVSNQVSAEFRKAVEAEGVAVSDWVVLRLLFGSPGVAPASLIASLGMTKGAVSKIVTRLEQAGWVGRIADPDDGRAQAIVLTAAGRRLVPRLAALADRNDARFFGHLTQDQRDALISLMRDIVVRQQIGAVPVE